MLSNDKKDENTQTKLAQVLAWSTESFPQSEKLWHLRLSYLLTTNNEDQSNELFKQVRILLAFFTFSDFNRLKRL